MQLLILDTATLYVILTVDIVKVFGKRNLSLPHNFMPAYNITKSMFYDFFSKNNPAKVYFNHKEEIHISVS